MRVCPLAEHTREIRPESDSRHPGTRLAICVIVANPGPKHVCKSSTMTPTSTRPVCDEWGVYDPEQAGFEAVIRRLFPEEDDAKRPKASSLPLSLAASTRWS